MKRGLGTASWRSRWQLLGDFLTRPSRPVENPNVIHVDPDVSTWKKRRIASNLGHSILVNQGVLNPGFPLGSYPWSQKRDDTGLRTHNHFFIARLQSRSTNHHSKVPSRTLPPINTGGPFYKEHCIPGPPVGFYVNWLGPPVERFE